jgi:hypothetical protein
MKILSVRLRIGMRLVLGFAGHQSFVMSVGVEEGFKDEPDKLAAGT